MSKKIGLVAGAIVVVAGLFLFLQSSKTKPSTSTAVTEEKPASSESATKGTIKSLLAGGKNVKCDITYTDGKGTGTVYVSDKKFRGDFNVVTASKEVVSHMIQDATYTYVWSGDSKQGTKFTVSAMEQAAASPNAQTAQSNDLDRDVDMKCASWGVDSSKFMPPGDVMFQDMSAAMGKTQPQTTASPKSSGSSSVCDAITDPAAKAACMGAGGGY